MSDIGYRMSDGGRNPDTELTHFDERGGARMVDVSGKEPTHREAVARAIVKMKSQTLEMIKSGGVKKGDVLAVAQVAGVMAAKKASELIPMCHPIGISGVNINFSLDEEESNIEIEAAVKTMDRTGVEMEALVASSIAALTIYDMCKSVDRGMTIAEVQLVRKSGGKSGEFVRE